MRGVMTENLKNKIDVILPYLMILTGFILILWRAHKGVIWADEPYYFATAWRFAQGDLPVVDDWYPAQLYSVLLVPAVQLWHYIFGSFDGIYYFFRLFYCVLQLCAALLIYRILLKRTGEELPPLICALLFLFYCKNNILTLSYYAVAVICLTLICLLLPVLARNTRQNRVRVIFVGLCYAVVLICNPYLLLHLLAVVLWLFFGRRKRKAALYLLLTAALADISLALPVLLFSSIGDVLEGLAHIGGTDGYFRIAPLAENLARAAAGALWDAKFILPVIGMIWFHKKTGKLSENVLQIANAAALILNLLLMRQKVYLIGNVCVCLAACGTAILLQRGKSRKEDRDLVFCLGVLPLLSGVLYVLSSDTGYSAFVNGLYPIEIGAVLLISVECKRTVSNKSRTLYRVGCMLAAAVLIIGRVTFVYRDDGLSKLTVPIDSGPAKGLYTTAHQAEKYNAVIETARQMEQARSELPNSRRSEERLCVLGFAPWAYLACTSRCGAYTCWRYYAQEDKILGRAYYQVHPDYFPGQILVLGSEYLEDDPASPESWMQSWMESYTVMEAVNRGYEITDVPCGIMLTQTDGR